MKIEGFPFLLEVAGDNVSVFVHCGDARSAMQLVAGFFEAQIADPKKVVVEQLPTVKTTKPLISLSTSGSNGVNSKSNYIALIEQRSKTEVLHPAQRALLIVHKVMQEGGTSLSEIRALFNSKNVYDSTIMKLHSFAAKKFNKRLWYYFKPEGTTSSRRWVATQHIPKFEAKLYEEAISKE